MEFDWSTQLLIGYCFLICVASVCGGFVTSLFTLSHTRLQLLISFVGGLMLGVGVLHQLPHAVAVLTDEPPAVALNWTAAWLMAGLLAMFLLLRMFHFHQHEPCENEESAFENRECSHDRNAPHDHSQSAGMSSISWLGVTFGLCLHTILDGIALASHVHSDSLHHHHHAGETLLGLGTFLGVLLHKPLDSLSIVSLMRAAGWSPVWRNAVNLGYALMCPLGAGLFYLGLQSFQLQEQLFASAALAFSAGVFLTIALSDLLPEVQFHSHDRLQLSLALLFGAISAWGIGFLEPAHAHGHSTVENQTEPTHGRPELVETHLHDLSNVIKEIEDNWRVIEAAMTEGNLQSVDLQIHKAISLVKALPAAAQRSARTDNDLQDINDASETLTQCLRKIDRALHAGKANLDQDCAQDMQSAIGKLKRAVRT